VLLARVLPHWTFAVTDAVPFSVKVQLLALFPPLEQAPDQIASRPFDTLSVIAVPVENDADPVLPTATLIPAGVELMLSPSRPVAVTVSVADGGGGGAAAFTLSAANRNWLPIPADSWTVVPALGNVVIVKLALVAPAATVTFVGTLAAPGWLLPKLTTVPPAGAGLESVTVPVDGLPPVTLVGLTLKDESVAGGGGGGAASGVTVKVADKVTPPPLTEIVTTVCVVT
jgi:hypothetical protein